LDFVYWQSRPFPVDKVRKWPKEPIIIKYHDAKDPPKPKVGEVQKGGRDPNVMVYAEKLTVCSGSQQVVWEEEQGD
jgi:hypothetical protein